MVEAIDAIMKICKRHFTSTFKLRRSEYNKYVIDGDPVSRAMSREEVNVLQWFDDFWLYIEINFKNTESGFPKTFVTISLFEGERITVNKTHHFRAEWDDFEGNEQHPQPHWHIYPNKWNPSIEGDFEAFSELKKEDGFTGYKIIDIVEMHFAMQGMWADRKGHIHKISGVDSMAYWMDGILGHIKYQIQYVLKGKV